MRDGSLRYYVVSFIPLILFIYCVSESFRLEKASLFISNLRLQIHRQERRRIKKLLEERSVYQRRGIRHWEAVRGTKNSLLGTRNCVRRQHDSLLPTFTHGEILHPHYLVATTPVPAPRFSP
jgi:hypothetical protein